MHCLVVPAQCWAIHLSMRVHLAFQMCPLAKLVREGREFAHQSLYLAVQWGVFVLFACCVFLMTLSVYLFFPETKGVPIEDCPYVFKHHWYWKK